MLKQIGLMTILLTSLLFSMTASACDDKACETAYLAATKQYVANHIRQAKAYEIERHAHSKNRARRAYAHYVHVHMMLFGQQPSKNI